MKTKKTRNIRGSNQKTKKQEILYDIFAIIIGGLCGSISGLITSLLILSQIN